MDPLHIGRKSKNDIVFRAGDLRSTYDELLEKSSDASLRVDNTYKKLYEMLLSEEGIQEELQNTILYYFLACKITAEEAGDLVLEDERVYHDAPPICTDNPHRQFGQFRPCS